MSEIVTIEPPQDRAVTLEEARQQLRLDGRDEDLLLVAKLDAAQAELEQQTGLKLCEQTLELQLQDWLDEITVPIRPCTVAEIRYTALGGSTVALPEADYVVRRRHGVTRIRPASDRPHDAARMASASGLGGRSPRCASTTLPRRCTRMPGMSIATGQTSPHAPHSVEA